MDVLPFTVDIIAHESDLKNIDPEYGNIYIAADTRNEFIYQSNKWEIFGNADDNDTETKIVYNHTHCQCCGAPYSSERDNCEYCGTLYT